MPNHLPLPSMPYDSGIPRSIASNKPNHKSNGTKKDHKKLSRREQERQASEYNAYWSHLAYQPPYPLPPIEHLYAAETTRAGEERSMHSKSNSLRSFHFSPDAATFTPSVGNFQAKPLLNKQGELSPGLDEDASSFSPSIQEKLVDSRDQGERASGRDRTRDDEQKVGRSNAEMQTAQGKPSSAAKLCGDNQVISDQDSMLEETPKQSSESLLDLHTDHMPIAEEQLSNKVEYERSLPAIVNKEDRSEDTNSIEGMPAYELSSVLEEGPSIEEQEGLTVPKNGSISQIAITRSEGPAFEPYPDQYSEGAFKEPIIPQPSVHTKSDGEELQNIESSDTPDNTNEKDAPRSPPHSSFSLLPPVSVEDVLGKARELWEGVQIDKDQQNQKLEKSEGEIAVDEKVEEKDITISTQQAGKGSDEDEKFTEEEASVKPEGLDESMDANNEASSILPETTEAEILTQTDELNFPTHHLHHLHSSQFSDSVGPSEISQHSISPSEAEEALLSPGGMREFREVLEAEIERATMEQESKKSAEAPDFNHVSDRVKTELNANYGDPGQSPNSPDISTKVPATKIISNSQEVYNLGMHTSNLGQDSILAERVEMKVPAFDIICRSEERCDIEEPVDISEQSNSSTGQSTFAQDLIPKERDLPESISTSLEQRNISPTLNARKVHRLSTATSAYGQGMAKHEELTDLEDVDSLSRRIRSSAPSPPSSFSELPSIVTTEATPSETTFATSGHAVPADLFPSSRPSSPSKPISSPKILANHRLEKPPSFPPLQRIPSQAEKEEAIRLIAELRSEPPTPALVDAGFSKKSADAGSSQSQVPQLKFDLSQQVNNVYTSKRKRGVSENDRENTHQDQSEDEQEKKKPSQGEAPSLTLSIFSGSIIPKKQLVLSVLASLGINLFLPFVNGVMLGKYLQSSRMKHLD